MFHGLITTKLLILPLNGGATQRKRQGWGEHINAPTEASTITQLTSTVKKVGKKEEPKKERQSCP